MPFSAAPQAIVSPFGIRPLFGATISMPRQWKEVDKVSGGSARKHCHRREPTPAVSPSAVHTLSRRARRPRRARSGCALSVPVRRRHCHRGGVSLQR